MLSQGPIPCKANVLLYSNGAKTCKKITSPMNIKTYVIEKKTNLIILRIKWFVNFIICLDCKVFIETTVKFRNVYRHLSHRHVKLQGEEDLHKIRDKEPSPAKSVGISQLATLKGASAKRFCHDYGILAMTEVGGVRVNLLTMYANSTSTINIMLNSMFNLLLVNM